MSNRSLRFLIPALLSLSLVAACQPGAEASGASKPTVIRLDFATYNPASLVLKANGWLEEALAPEGITVEWVQTLGSNQALSFLQGNSIDFGSSAGAAALVSASNGNPVNIVYLYSKPEWTALVTGAGSSIQSVADLKGKKVAATLGTDPYIFLLRSLAEAGLTDQDIQLVPLQHGDGAAALVAGQVDAWAGLDPHMARVELENGARLFHRNIDFNTYGVLNVRSEFAERYPAYVDKVIQVYERARQAVRDDRTAAAAVLAQVAQIRPEVATLQLTQRTDLSNPYPNADLSASLLAAGRVLQAGGHIKPEVNVDTLVTSLIQPQWAARALKP